MNSVRSPLREQFCAQRVLFLGFAPSSDVRRGRARHAMCMSRRVEVIQMGTLREAVQFVWNRIWVVSDRIVA